MSYMLIELSTGNVVGFFSTERDALREVAESIQEDGPGAVDTLALGYNDPADPVRAIAEGADLAARALGAVSPVYATNGGPPSSSPGLRSTAAPVPLTGAEDRQPTFALAADDWSSTGPARHPALESRV